MRFILFGVLCLLAAVDGWKLIPSNWDDLANSVNDIGNSIVSTANNVGQSVNDAVQTATKNNVANQVANSVQGAFGAIKTQAEQAGDFLNGHLNQVFNIGEIFGQAKQAWGCIDWQNGDDILNAIKLTAEAVRSVSGPIAMLENIPPETRKSMNDVANVAGGVFPPLGLVMKAGKIVMTVAGQTQDISSLVFDISNGLQTQNYPQVISASLKLCKIIYAA